MKDFTMILVGLFFGLIFGYISGLATSYGDIEDLAKRKFKIVGDVTIQNSSDKPIYVGDLEINSNGEVALSINGPVRMRGDRS